jgi:hypothetical protein
MYRYGDKWREKALVVSKFLESIGTPASQLVAKYEGSQFEDGMDRARVFSEILSAFPSDEVVDYLDRRCTEGFGHFRGDRSGAEYAADLIISWIQEDAIISKFSENGLALELDGTDSHRDFLPGTRVSTTSDFLFSMGYSKRKLEVSYDSTGHWRTKHKFDLRDSKFSRLLDEKAIILGVAIPSAEAFIIDLSMKFELEVRDIPFHFIYKKPAKSIIGVDSILRPLDDVLKELGFHS